MTTKRRLNQTKRDQNRQSRQTRRNNGQKRLQQGGTREDLLYAINADEVLAVLEDGELDVNLTDEEGNTPLMLASQRASQNHADENARITQVLIEAGADVNATNMDDRTALMFAARSGVTEVIRLLIDSGADVNARDKRSMRIHGGKTVLMFAVERGHSDATRMLIDAGAEVNAYDNNGKTILMYAVKYRSTIGNNGLLVIQALIDEGIEKDELDSALRFAVQRKDKQAVNIVRALAKAGADVNSMMTEKRVNFSTNRRPRRLKESWQCPLMCAVKNQSKNVEDMIRLLIEIGAKVDTQEEIHVGPGIIRVVQGDTALHMAAKSRSFHAVKVLTEVGADITIVNDEGYIPLDFFREDGKLNHKKDGKFINLLSNPGNQLPPSKSSLTSSSSSKKQTQTMATPPPPPPPPKKAKKGKSGKEEVCGYNPKTSRCSRESYPHQKERCELNPTTKRCKKKELDKKTVNKPKKTKKFIKKIIKKKNLSKD